MMARLKAHWGEFKRLEPGQRFQTHYHRHQQSKNGKSLLWRVLYLAAGVAALAVGVVLMFIPGPAILFFLIAGALFAMQSLRVARALDWSELRLRALADAIRRRRLGHRASMPSRR